MSKSTHTPIGTHIPADTQAQEHTPTPMQATVQAHIRAQANLTPKQKQFVANVVDKQMTKTEAYLDAYDHTGTRKSAHEIASQTSRIPQVKAELEWYRGNAKDNLMRLADKTTEYAMEGGRDGAAYASVAEKINNSIVDRLEGRAKQSIDINSKAVTLNIDLTGVVEAQTGAPADKQEGEPTPPLAPLA